MPSITLKPEYGWNHYVITRIVICVRCVLQVIMGVTGVSSEDTNDYLAIQGALKDTPVQDVSITKIKPCIRAILLDRVVKIAKSIEELGQVEPITVDKDYEIIDGNHRYFALLKLKRKTIKCRMYLPKG